MKKKNSERFSFIYRHTAVENSFLVCHSVSYPPCFDGWRPAGGGEATFAKSRLDKLKIPKDTAVVFLHDDPSKKTEYIPTR